MLKSEFETLLHKAVAVPQGVKAADLTDQTPRTLAYGYTCERETFHIYLAEDGIHKVVYSFGGVLLLHTHESEGLPFEQCVPDKRLYPEACDLEFCTLLKSRNVHLPFTTWNERRVPQQFHGICLEELSLPGMAA